MIEWLATASGEIDPDSHGDGTVGVRSGAWSAMFRSEALDLRWAPAWDTGNAWVSVRGHAFATGMLFDPWTDGAPDPTRALYTPSAGVDAGAVRYAPDSGWFGVRGSADAYVFLAGDETTIDVPAPRLVGSLDVLAGLWRPALAVTARAGGDLQAGGDVIVGPHVAAELHWAPRWTIAPRVEVWAGAAEGQDFVTRTRLGGLTPWAVPLAGAGWAEFRVEDYAVARLGPSVGGDGFRVGPFADLAAWDGDATASFGAQGRVWKGRAYAEAAGGYAPWIERQAGVGRACAWVSLGLDWGAGWRPGEDRVPGPYGSTWPR